MIVYYGVDLKKNEKPISETGTENAAQMEPKAPIIMKILKTITKIQYLFPKPILLILVKKQNRATRILKTINPVRQEKKQSLATAELWTLVMMEEEILNPAKTVITIEAKIPKIVIY